VSFDISFVPVHQGEPKTAKNPFTNADVIVRPRTMAAHELTAVTALLSTKNEDGVDLGDGSSTALFGDPLDDGFMLALHSWTRAQSELVFALCARGNLIAMLDDFALCATDAAMSAIDGNEETELMGELIRVSSAAEVYDRVAPAFATWTEADEPT
jgi:hypothetical protein